MSKRCDITKKGSQAGYKISHAHNKSRKTWEANLHHKWLFDSDTRQWVRGRVSSRVLRTIARKGLGAVIKDNGFKIEKGKLLERH